MREWWKKVSAAAVGRGGETPGTYWARRAMVLGMVAAVAIIAATVYKVTAPLEQASVDDPEHVRPVNPTATKRPLEDRDLELAQPQAHRSEESPEPEPEESESPAEPEPCEQDGVRLQVVSALREAYVGTTVPVSVLVVNEERADCEIRWDRVVLQARNGNDIVYASDHCGDEPEGTAVLKPGDGETVEFDFAAKASDEACEGERRELPAGDYDLVAAVGESEADAGLRLK
ncbi:hypothetical protein [Salininema proteolyticum]|uniref:Uncharacterized protein n=1 Tax=Salininema proteolyticum TaxID=1607685 RepID=A0ABV8TTL4_9ACTN